jgi:hypothetical protein
MHELKKLVDNEDEHDIEISLICPQKRSSIVRQKEWIQCLRINEELCGMHRDHVAPHLWIKVEHLC